MTHLEIRMYTARKRITYSKHLPQFIDSRTEMTLITEVIDSQGLLLNWIELGSERQSGYCSVKTLIPYIWIALTDDLSGLDAKLPVLTFAQALDQVTKQSYATSICQPEKNDHQSQQCRN